MNTFRLTGIFHANLSDADAELALRQALRNAGFTLGEDNYEPTVERTNYLVGDTVTEIWAHQGEDGWGMIDLVRGTLEGGELEGRWGGSGKRVKAHTYVVEQKHLDEMEADRREYEDEYRQDSVHGEAANR